MENKKMYARKYLFTGISLQNKNITFFFYPVLSSVDAESSILVFGVIKTRAGSSLRGLACEGFQKMLFISTPFPQSRLSTLLRRRREKCGQSMSNSGSFFFWGQLLCTDCRYTRMYRENLFTPNTNMGSPWANKKVSPSTRSRREICPFHPHFNP